MDVWHPRPQHSSCTTICVQLSLCSDTKSVTHTMYVPPVFLSTWSTQLVPFTVWSFSFLGLNTTEHKCVVQTAVMTSWERTRTGTHSVEDASTAELTTSGRILSRRCVAKTRPGQRTSPRQKQCKNTSQWRKKGKYTSMSEGAGDWNSMHTTHGQSGRAGSAGLEFESDTELSRLIWSILQNVWWSEKDSDDVILQKEFRYFRWALSYNEEDSAAHCRSWVG